MEATFYLNDGGARPAYTISGLDFTQRFNVNAIYEPPIGKGKSLLGAANRLLDLVLGGWRMLGSFDGRSSASPANAAFGSITAEKGHGQRRINLF